MQMSLSKAIPKHTNKHTKITVSQNVEDREENRHYIIPYINIQQHTLAISQGESIHNLSMHLHNLTTVAATLVETV